MAEGVPGSPGATPPEGSFPGAEVLRGKSPREVLHRLLDHDPFEIDARSRARVEEQAYLVSSQRVELRALARIAYAAMKYRGKPALDEWIRGRIDASIEEILDEDLEAELTYEPLEPPYAAHLRFVAERFGVELGLARRACLRFNALPLDVRRAFFAVAVHGKSVNRWVAEGFGPPADVHAALMRAVQALSAPSQADNGDLEEVDW